MSMGGLAVSGETKASPNSCLASRRRAGVALVLLVVSPFARRLIPRQLPPPGLLAGVETVPCGTTNVTVAAQHPASPYCGLAARTPAATPPDWCVPTRPWYYLDNGGNTCVCEQKWDARLYASKVWLSVGYDVPHTLMNVNLYVFLQSAERTLLVSLLNEVIEESIIMVFGVWGFTDLTAAVPSTYTMLNVETRYDSLIRDVLVNGLPGIVIGYMVVACSGATPFLVGTWTQFLASILMYFVLSDMNALYATATDVGRLYVDNLVLVLIYAAVLSGVWRVCGRHEPPALFAYWFAAAAALLLPAAYPLERGTALVCYSSAFAVVLLLVMQRLAGQWRAQPAGRAGVSGTPVLLSDVVSGSKAPSGRIKGQLGRALYSPYPFLAFALVLVFLAANRFFVAPLRGDAVVASYGWCGMGTVSDVESSSLGGAACAALDALVTADARP